MVAESCLDAKCAARVELGEAEASCNLAEAVEVGGDVVVLETGFGEESAEGDRGGRTGARREFKAKSSHGLSRNGA